MDNFFMFFMLICCYPILLLISLILANETKPKNNIVLGVTLPLGKQGEPAVKAICIGYRKKLRNGAIVLTLLLLPVFFLPSFSVMLTACLCWLLLAIVVPFVFYAMAHLRLKALKQANEWFGGVAKRVLSDVTVTAALRKPFSRWLFLPAFILSLLPLVIAYWINQDQFYAATVTLSSGSIILLSLFSYPLLFRRKGDDGGDLLSNVEFTGARLYQWGKCWLLLSYLTALFALTMWFVRNSDGGILFAVALYTLAAIALCGYTEFNARKAQEKLTAQYGEKQYVDEDAFWLLGMFYDHPDDHRLIVNKRVGIGVTLNLARPAAKVLSAFVLLVLVTLPLIGAGTIYEEYTPITVMASETAVRVSHLGFEITVDYDDVEEAALLYELPGLSRLNGTSLATVEKGKFSVRGYGVCEVCLDPRAGAFLVLKTGEKTYLISTPATGETEQIYRWLRHH
ncbi:MAG TPA: DUF5808 domain-containing protein [Clostridiales bacterium]|nr:DUF5808 domain-containing protein [Clostridiales bacterium]